MEAHGGVWKCLIEKKILSLVTYGWVIHQSRKSPVGLDRVK